MPKSDHPRVREITTGEILSYLVSITTILGIPVALYGYFAAKQETRVDRTYDYYKQYHDSELPGDVNLLVNMWNAKADEANQLLAKQDYDGLAKLQSSLVQDGKVNAALARIVVFYDEVGTCVANLLCDSDTAYALLYHPAYQIASAYGGYLTSYETVRTPFAQGIFTVAHMPAPKKWWLF